MSNTVMLPPGGAEEFNGGKWWQRLHEAFARGIVGFFRQSSLDQAKHNLGSQQVQREQMKHLEPFGIREADVNVVLAFGESGRPHVVRERFAQLTEMVMADKVGLIVLARHDRLGRDSEASSELFRRMKEHGVLIMVDGRIYDPADANDAFVLEIHALVAELDNRARARWNALSRFAKARSYSARIPLPAGLVWAAPDDPAYRDALESAGLLDWIANMSGHLVVSLMERELDEDDGVTGSSAMEVAHNTRPLGRRLYILPYPDAEVVQAVRLTIRWLLETGSLTKLLERVQSGHPGWPRPGLMPLRVGSSRYGQGASVRWVPVNRTRLYEYLQSPSLYGIYRYEARSLRPRVPRGPNPRTPRPRR